MRPNWSPRGANGSGCRVAAPCDWSRRIVAVAVLVALMGVVGPPVAGDEMLGRYIVDDVDSREDRNAIAFTGADIEAVSADHVIVIATGAEHRAIRDAGFSPRLAEAEAHLADFPLRDSNYHNYAEMVADIQAVAAAHPSTVRLFSIGKSFQGRELWAARISNDAADNLSEPGVLYVGMHHGREHISLEVVLGLLHLFAESTDPAVQSLVNTRQIYIVFNLNPDGAEYDIAGDVYASWRKNRQPTPGTNKIGTDLNRNYEYRWGGRGSSGKPGSSTYRGPAPWSAPEAARLRDFVVAHSNIRTAISYHSYGSLILYPYGYTTRNVPSDMVRLHRKAFVQIAAEMQRTSGYTAQQSSDLYLTSGDFIDWMYGARRIFAFTFELSGSTFYPGDEVIPSEQARNRAAALYAARVADCPTVVVDTPCS